MRGIFERMRRLASSAIVAGSARPAMSASSIAPPRDAHNIGNHRGELDIGTFQHALHPIDLADRSCTTSVR